LSIVLAVTGPGMPSSGWQTELSGRLQHLSATTLQAVSWLPGWALLTILAAGFAVLIGRAIRRRPSRTSTVDHSHADDMTTVQEGQR
jgi:cytochrome c-type biogenesis protein